MESLCVISFHSAVAAELVKDGYNRGVVLLGNGLGISEIVNEILLQHSSNKKFNALTLILGHGKICTEPQCELLNSSISPEERSSNYYTKGGVFRVTSRVFLIDLLTERLPADLIDCLICLDCHQLAFEKNSVESFCMSLYLRKCRSDSKCFGVSDRPDLLGTTIKFKLDDIKINCFLVEMQFIL